MATTKTLLEKAMLKVGAHSAVPTSRKHLVSVGNYTPEEGSATVRAEYIPPTDGFLTLYGQPVYADNTCCKIFIADKDTSTDTADYAYDSSQEYGGNYGVDLFSPVAKGHTYVAVGYGVTSLGITFLKSIGGGA